MRFLRAQRTRDAIAGNYRFILAVLDFHVRALGAYTRKHARFPSVFARCTKVDTPSPLPVPLSSVLFCRPCSPLRGERVRIVNEARRVRFSI